MCKERGSNHCYLDHGYDPRHGVDDQEELDHEEDNGFDGSLASGLAQEDREEEGCG